MEKETNTEKREGRCGAGGNVYREIQWPEGICTYIREALEERNCPCYLPVRFLCTQGKYTAFYDDSGCLTLGEVFRQEAQNGASLLRLAIHLFRMLAEDEISAEDYLLSRDYMRYDLDVLYWKRDAERTSAAYVPRSDERLFYERFSDLLEALISQFEQGGLHVLRERMDAERMHGNLGTKDMLRLFSQWEREV